MLVPHAVFKGCQNLLPVFSLDMCDQSVDGLDALESFSTQDAAENLCRFDMAAIDLPSPATNPARKRVTWLSPMRFDGGISVSQLRFLRSNPGRRTIAQQDKRKQPCGRSGGGWLACFAATGRPLTARPDGAATRKRAIPDVPVAGLSAQRPATAGNVIGSERVWSAWQLHSCP